MSSVSSLLRCFSVTSISTTITHMILAATYTPAPLPGELFSMCVSAPTTSWPGTCVQSGLTSRVCFPPHLATHYTLHLRVHLRAHAFRSFAALVSRSMACCSSGAPLWLE